MIDIHMHLIPGVDDGAEDLSMAASMLYTAREQGIQGIFATPHSSAFDDDATKVYAQWEQLQQRAGMPLWLGCEVYCQGEDMGRIVNALETGLYPSMNQTQYVLTEFSMWVRPERTIPCMEALVAAGWIPIVAHMERYAYLRENMDLVDTLRKMGCKLQCNAYSFFDEGDETIKAWARRLAAERKVDFLGTDAHRTYHRPPSAAMGLSWLYDHEDKGYIDAISHGNAAQLLGI